MDLRAPPLQSLGPKLPGHPSLPSLALRCPPVEKIQGLESNRLVLLHAAEGGVPNMHLRLPPRSDPSGEACCASASHCDLGVGIRRARVGPSYELCTPYRGAHRGAEAAELSSASHPIGVVHRGSPHVQQASPRLRLHHRPLRRNQLVDVVNSQIDAEEREENKFLCDSPATTTKSKDRSK